MRIIQLPDASSASPDDVFVININGVDYQVTGATLAAMFKNDVLTISQQQLTAAQKAQVQENLGLEIATLAEVISYLGLS